MTIKELLDVTVQDTTIRIAWGGDSKELRREDTLEIDAYGPYVIDYLDAIAENTIEAGIKMQPVKGAIQ